MKPATVNVDCPRCDVPIVCTLERKPHGSRVPDLAKKFAAHYKAEHEAAAVGRVYLDVVPQWADLDAIRADVGLPSRSEIDNAAEMARRHGVKLDEDEIGRR
jgi:hypothetical protein